MYRIYLVEDDQVIAATIGEKINRLGIYRPVRRKLFGHFGGSLLPFSPIWC